MKVISLLSILLSFIVLGACKTADNKKCQYSEQFEVTGPIEITSHSVEETGTELCSIQGTLVDENGETMIGSTAKIVGLEIGAYSDIDGKFRIDKIPAGIQTLELSQLGVGSCTVKFDLKEGDLVKFEAILALYSQIQLEKPIIYLYPETKTEVEIELVYDGKITTTYPKYQTNGWKVIASPDGTLIDENDKEYYALYWEGEPTKPLGITDGFVVSKERTIPFLEEKLSLLGLNSKESNEFIIYWLPILEKNNFNLIHFAEDDYLDQAKLNVTPTPETTIRIAMVFKGLDKEIEVPMQDLSPLTKVRSGFTLVEWGGQELPKEYNLGL